MGYSTENMHDMCVGGGAGVCAFVRGGMEGCAGMLMCVCGQKGVMCGSTVCEVAFVVRM